MLQLRAAVHKAIHSFVGETVRREDAVLVSGRGIFTDDISPPDCVYLKFVRSCHASGKLNRIDADPARVCRGVLAVLTSKDIEQMGKLAVNPLFDDMQMPPFTLLACDRVDAVGQPVAAVIAETAMQAEDALGQILVDIEPDDSIEEARDCFEHRWQSGDVDSVFDTAKHVVRTRVEYARLAPMALEPRATVAQWDRGTGRLTVWLGTQTPHRARSDLAEVLGLHPDNIRVVTPCVGGAFGGKASIYPEDIVVALAAIRLERPVKWCAARSEEFLAGTQGRGASLEGELATSADGTILGLRARLDFPLGHWLPFSAAVPAHNAGRILPGPYRVEAVDIEVRGAIGNTAPIGIYRGAGRPEATMLMERLIDAASLAVGLDPIEFRRRNLLAKEAFPYRTPTGQVYDSGDFEGLLERACSVSCYPALLKEKAKRRSRGEKYGLGVSFYVEPCGSGWESARIHLERDGTIVAATGTSAQGQGRETTFAQIVANVLNVPSDRIVVRHGDTDLCPPGIGALASRSTAIGGVAMHQAACEFGARAKAATARILGRMPESLISDAEGVGDGNGKSVRWIEIAEQTWADTNNEKPGLETTSIFHAEGEAWSSGCCIAAISVDSETGIPTIERVFWVDDAGIIINPTLARGQLLGGLAQGIGEALMERMAYDGDGQLGTGSLMDYAVPRAHHVPEITIASLATPARTALGAKGVGEAGTIGIPAAIANGIADAVAPVSIESLTLPLTSGRIWQIIRDGLDNTGGPRS